MQLFSTTRLERSFILIFVLKVDNEVRVLSFLDSLDHNSGPKYLRECLPQRVKPGNTKV